MAQYNLSGTINKDKVFLIKHSELEGRFDPLYYCSDLNKFNSGKYPVVRLSNIIVDIKSGIGAGRKDQTEETEGIIQIRPTNIDENGFLKFSKNIYIPSSIFIDKLEIDDVIFNNTNSQELVGKTAILKEKKELSFSNHITRLKIDKIQCLPDYLWIILNIYQRNKIFYSICTNWNNQSGIGIELLKSLRIPLPPIHIQQQIVDLYETAYIHKHQKEAEAKQLLNSIDPYLLDELGIILPKKDNSLQSRIFTTQFKDISGGRLDANGYKQRKLRRIINGSKYPIKKLNYLAQSIKTGTTPHNSLQPFTQSGILFLRNSDIQDSSITLDDIKYIKEELRDNLTYSHEGELIICIAGTVGVAAINNIGEIAINQNISSLKLNTNINPVYLKFYFNSNLNIEFIKLQASIATILYINNKNLLDVPIPLPPLEKQNEIANHIQDIRDKAKQLQEEAVTTLEKAKKEVEKMILGD